MFARRITRSGPTIVAFIAFLISTALTGTAPAAHDGLSRLPLSQQNTGVEVGASGMDQCALPLAERRGRWLCPDQKTLTSPIEAATPAEGALRGVGLPLPLQRLLRRHECARHLEMEWRDARPDGWICGHSADRRSQLEQAGSVRHLRDTHEVIFTGDLLNAAPGVDGDQIDGKFSLYLAGNAGAGQSKTWDPNGYKAYDNTMWDHTLVHQFSFKHSDYPGYWYLYVKSICMHTNDKQIYRYYGVRQVPNNSDGGGWRR